jgi:hypothetical protein
MIKGMDKQPHNPKSTDPTGRRAQFARRRLTVLVVGVLVAGATLGTGIFMNRETPTWQRILGTEPVVIPEPKATDELPLMLASVTQMLQYPDASTGAKTTTVLAATQTMLREHVELLTPGALAALETAQSPASDQNSEPAPVAAIPPLSVSEFSTDLAQAGNGLLKAALSAQEQEARRLSGSGIELVLQARSVLAASGASDATLNALPSPLTELEASTEAASSKRAKQGPTVDQAALASMPAFVVDACPAVTASATTTDAAASSSGAELGGIVDAAYRMGYAYNVAGARTSGALRSTAWERSEVLVDFASALETKLNADHDCAPLRQAAYQLPKDAVKNPMDAARSGEGQLALLLRDGAAGQSGEARTYLLSAAYSQALAARQLSGKTVDFTAVEPATAASAGEASPTPAS